jgi:hypothetical protein
MILNHILTFFASDEMAGRETGTVQNDAAASRVNIVINKTIYEKELYFSNPGRITVKL